MDIDIKNDTAERCRKEFERYKQLFSFALKAAKVCIFEVDLEKQLYTFFENAEDIFGISGDKILKDVQPFRHLSPDEYQRAASDYFSHPDDRVVIQKAFHTILQGKSTTYEARMKAGNTNFVWCKIDVAPIMENGQPVRMVGVITDISEIHERTKNLEKKSYIDSFTGLYNKNYAQRMMKEVLSELPDQKHALLLIDIDNFKQINDTLGHAVGDHILQSFSGQLKSSFSGQIKGRFGGDEFFVLVQNIQEDKNKFLSAIQELLTDKNTDYIYTKSIGIAYYPDDASNFYDLFDKADLALYQSKLKKNAFVQYQDI